MNEYYLERLERIGECILGDGLITVVDGQRIYLRVYRRVFYPLLKKINGIEYKFYSDTGRQVEINYKKAAYYELDNPFNRIRLVRLARAMNSINCKTLSDGKTECVIVVCNTREMFEPTSEENKWIPFDPSSFESLSERIMKLKRKIEWKNRVESC
jgi:hypothetical protein